MYLDGGSAIIFGSLIVREQTSLRDEVKYFRHPKREIWVESLDGKCLPRYTLIDGRRIFL